MFCYSFKFILRYYKGDEVGDPRDCRVVRGGGGGEAAVQGLCYIIDWTERVKIAESLKHYMLYSTKQNNQWLTS